MLIISLKQIPHDKQHEYAHKLLRAGLKLKGIDYKESVKIIKGIQGKPSLEDYPEVHYNLSHADGTAACIISCYECGIDAERIRPYRPNVVKRAFSNSEKALIENTPECERDELFFRLWTLKESYVKAIGIGVSYPMRTVEFCFNGSEIISNIENCRFKQYVIDQKFIVSVCEIMNDGKEC